MLPSLPFDQTELGCRIVDRERWQVDLSSGPAGVQVARSKPFPWLFVGRLPRFGGAHADTPTQSAPELAELARSRPLLRLHAEVWEPDPARRRALAEALADAGFVQPARPRAYEHSVLVDLEPTEDEMMASFSSTCRRHIRAPAKKGFEMRPIRDSEHAPVLQEILTESFARTGSAPPEIVWDAIFEALRDDQAPLELVGLFRADEENGTPYSFAMAVLHGDVVEYSHAGSVRRDDVKVPLLYSCAWSLMQWAKARGATRFDFGGVPRPTDVEGRLSGIEAFKRSFSPDPVQVGDEWVLEPRPLLTGVLRQLGRGLDVRTD